MGFRSTLTSNDLLEDWPDWFSEKYAKFLTEGGVLFTPWMMKTYMNVWPDLPADVQRAMRELGRDRRFVYVWLHECGGITRVQVDQDHIYVTQPDDWTVPPDATEQNGTHNYCYGCSDAERFAEEDGSNWIEGLELKWTS